jgi:hypothetical protein
MGTVGAGFEFGMPLCTNIKRMAAVFNHFHDPAVRGSAGQGETCLFYGIPQFIIDFVAVAVAL